MTTVTRKLEWDSAHRVMRHESKCSTLHGHRYVALVTCEADQLDDCDRVIDFGVIREKVGGWIDQNWDHTTLVNSEDEELWAFCYIDQQRGKRPPYSFLDAEPTAETIARQLAQIASSLLAGTGVRVTEVEVFETPNCSAKVMVARPAVSA